jgi:hypothetical protein
MLEYPLQYAFFLLPTGLAVGVLSQSMTTNSLIISTKWTAFCVLLLASLALGVTIRDYFRVETSYNGLRFELKKIPSNIPATPPDVLTMTQWRKYLEFAREQPKSRRSASELSEMHDLVRTVPSPYVLYKYAAQLAYDGQTGEAQRWLRLSCVIAPPTQCETIEAEWALQSSRHPEIAAIPWPVQ